MSALSAIGQDGQVFYYENILPSSMQNMNSMINTVEAETQTNIGEDTDAKRTVDV